MCCAEYDLDCDCVNDCFKSTDEYRSSILKNSEGVYLVNMCKECLNLHNYYNSVDPTYNELIKFIRTDDTDQMPYSQSFVCIDYAVAVHNNAESMGIRAGVVDLVLCGEDHALNVFNTTDKGIVFIDCTNSGSGWNDDTVVDIVVGEEYIPHALFENGVYYDPMGKVISYEIIW